MFGLENLMYNQLKLLKNDFGIKGIKAEYEAEGSSFRDLVRLRRITSALNLELHLKIGGVEAINDIKESLELGVDGLVAPMVESAFGADKFIKGVDKIYKNEKKPYLTLNLETKNGFNDIDGILEIAKNSIDNITLGRSDFSKSFFNDDIYPDSEYVTQCLLKIGEKVKKINMNFTVGGSVTQNTVKIYKEIPRIKNIVEKIETRKVIMPISSIFQDDDIISEALKFEKLYILSKKEISDRFIEAEISRLTELERRI